jgi:hypothetical protein
MKRRTRVILIVAAMVVTLVSAFAWAALSWTRNLEDAANTGKDQAEAGARSLAAQDATAAVSQFREAAAAFTRAQDMLGPDWVGNAAGTIPWAARQYTAAKALVTIGVDVSTAGAALSTVLQEGSAETTASGSTRLGSLLAIGKDRIDSALVSLGDAAERAASLTEDGLDPRLAKAVHSLKDALSGVAPFLDRSRSLLALERYLLSSQRRILVISQNSAELRPTGGFAGTYGILDLGPQGFSLEKYADVYTLLDPPGRVTPPPGARMTNDFGFRDANWWIDFPTSARSMLGFWDQYGQKPVDGIIAIDVITVRDLLEVFGPVTVPSYNATFTAQNLLGKLLYLVEVKSGGGPTKKGVLVALANELEQRMLSASPGELARAALVLARSADAKHAQFYFTDGDAESAVEQAGWSGAIAPPEGTTDLLAVSNAMTKPGKVNIAMKKRAVYSVALQPDGSAETTLVLSYTNSAPASFSLSSSVFRDYLRVYRASGTVLTPGAVISSSGATVTVENGLPVVAHEFSLLRGASHTETVVTRVAAAWSAGLPIVLPRSPEPASVTGSASPSDGVSHYRLFIVRQADLQDIPTSVTVTVPQGWRVSGVTAWKTASGETLNTVAEEEVARLSLPLDGDVVLDVVMERR